MIHAQKDLPKPQDSNDQSRDEVPVQGIEGFLKEGPEGGGGGGGGINPISQPDFWPNPSPSSEISGKSQGMENQS